MRGGKTFVLDSWVDEMAEVERAYRCFAAGAEIAAHKVRSFTTMYGTKRHDSLGRVVSPRDKAVAKRRAANKRARKARRK